MTTPNTNEFTAIVDGFGAEALRDLMDAATQRLAQIATATPIGREASAVVLDRETFTHAVPQWTMADGQTRGVTIRAWSYRDRARAEREATDAKGVYSRWEQVIWEVKLAIIDPPDLPTEVIRGWNYEVVLAIHSAIERLAALPPALIAAELARLAGGVPESPTPAPAAPARHDPRPDPDQLGRTAGGAAGVDTGPAREPDDG